MYKLLVVANFKSYEKGKKEEGSYVLVLPYGIVSKTNEVLWGHYCSSTGWAIRDLQYTNRKKFLDEFFGVDNWEFELYDYTTNEELESYCKEIVAKCNLEKLKQQYIYYKEHEIHL